MRRIEVLDRETIDKIAAGEVVERPASVVKELVENAIDAGATAITAEIKEGGLALIRITDNGCGIPREEVATAFLRHATSKIRKVEDLTGIASLGFRGEALSSIAAVAQVELITKTPEDLTGIRYCIEGGVEKDLEEIGAPSGTTFLVRHLFYNTPARAKFLKSKVTEANAAATVMEQLALSHPNISFKYIQNGKNHLYTSGNGNLKEIVYQIYGRELTKELIPVEAKTELLTMQGFIGNPSVARGNRSYENYFVNGRYVKSKLLSKAIEDAYHGFMMQHRYPFTLLYLELDGDQVDVNVHPSKMELRFSHQEDIYHQLCLTLQNALLERERIPDVSPTREKRERGNSLLDQLQKQKLPEPFEEVRRQTYAAPGEGSTEAQPREEVPGQTDARLGAAARGENPAAGAAQRVSDQQAFYQSSASSLPATPAPSASASTPSEPFSSPSAPRQLDLFQDKMLSKEGRKRHRIIGQVFDTYWLIEYENALYIVDQHAAHEKVVYERMRREYQSKEINSQMLCPPRVISLTAKEAELMRQYRDIFIAFGYEIEEFGGKEYKICAVPSDLYRVDPGQLFVEILDQLENVSKVTSDLILERLASMSCKAAVKGNQPLSRPEAQALMDELLSLENPYHCPHGRPTIITMSRYELDKKFKRIL